MPIETDNSFFQLASEKTAANTLETAGVLIKSEAAVMDMQASALNDVHEYWTYLSIAFTFTVVFVCSIFAFCTDDNCWARSHVLLFKMKHGVKIGESPVKQTSPLGGLLFVLFVITAVALSTAQFLEFWFAGFDMHSHYMLNVQSKEPPMAKLELQIRAGGVPPAMCSRDSISLQLGSLVTALTACSTPSADYFDSCADPLPCVQSEDDGVCSIRLCHKQTKVYNTRKFTVKYNTFVTALETFVRVESALPDQTNSIRVQFWPKSELENAHSPESTLTGNISSTIKFQPEQYVSHFNGTQRSGYQVAAHFESQQAQASAQPAVGVDWPVFVVAFMPMPGVENVSVDSTRTYLAIALKILNSLSSLVGAFGFVLYKTSRRYMSYRKAKQEAEAEIGEDPDHEYQKFEEIDHDLVGSYEAPELALIPLSVEASSN